MQLQEGPQNTLAATPATDSPREETLTALETHSLYRFGLAYGRQVYRFRWLILLFWVIVLAVSLPFAASVAKVLSGGQFSLPGSDSQRVEQILHQKLKQNDTQVLVTFQAAHTLVSDASYQDEVNTFIRQAKTFEHVSDAISGGTGNDGKTTFVVVTFKASSDFVQEHLIQFKRLLPMTNATARAYLTGGPIVDSQVSQISEQDVESAEIVALPVALFVLFLVFNSLVAAMMPILLALVAVPVALAIIYGIALHTSTSVFVLNIASIIGLGISIDYSLFMTRRFRDELAQGRSTQEAIAWTVALAGEAVFFSGITVMIGFLGLLFIGIQFMTSFGTGGAVVVAVAALAALTLLPALLSILGRRINTLRLPSFARLFGGRKAATGQGVQEERSVFWHGLAMGVMRRPVTIILVVGVLLLAMSWPIFSINIGSSGVSSLPQQSEARQGLDILSQQFPKMNEEPIYIVAQTPHGSNVLTSDNLNRVDTLTQWLVAQQHVTDVLSLTRLPDTAAPPKAQLLGLYTSGLYQRDPGLARLVTSTTADDVTLITVDANTKIDSAEGKQLIDHLRAQAPMQGQGLTVFVGGTQATSLDFNRSLYDHFPITVVFILLSTYVLLLLMFRSVLLPLKAILMNILSVSAAIGLLVFVFQWGNLSGVLNFTSSGFIASIIPALMFCVLFGLSMDYEVFLLSRVREEWLRTHNNTAAVAYGLEKTGSVITSAALLFVIVTGAFTFTRLLETKEIGLGMTIAVLVDATIIRSLLVPATMRLLGRWNWWFPGRPLPVERKVEA